MENVRNLARTLATVSVESDINRMVADRIFHLPADALPPPYATDMEAAGQIADWLKTQPVDVSGVHSSHVTILTRDGQYFAASEESPAFALCVAALKYVGVPLTQR